MCLSRPAPPFIDQEPAEPVAHHPADVDDAAGRLDASHADDRFGRSLVWLGLSGLARHGRGVCGGAINPTVLQSGLPGEPARRHEDKSENGSQ